MKIKTQLILFLCSFVLLCACGHEIGESSLAPKKITTTAVVDSSSIAEEDSSLDSLDSDISSDESSEIEENSKPINESSLINPDTTIEEVEVIGPEQTQIIEVTYGPAIEEETTSQIEEEVEVIEEEEVVTTTTPTVQSSSWDGPVLTPSAGVVYGPSGKETYYNLDMSGVISIMRGMGFDEANYPYWVRSDGVKMLGSYCICAANLDVHPRGTLVESSLGTAIVCDTGGFAYSNPNQLDLATAW